MTDYTGPSSPPGSSAPVRRLPSPGDEAAATSARPPPTAGSRVTQTATDQAREVASETARQARDLLGEAGGQVR